MGGLEFYVFDSELWCKSDDGKNFIVDETQTELVSYILDNVRARYPEAYKAMEKHYKKSALNASYYQFLMARRFCKCNFGSLDTTESDMSISTDGAFHFEKVSCPLRGECAFEGVICIPKFDSKLSSAEERVMRLYYKGCDKDEISEQLYISPNTVKSHIRNAYLKLGVQSKSEFINYANGHNMFQTD